MDPSKRLRIVHNSANTNKKIWFVDNDIAYTFLLHHELKEESCRNRVRMFDDGDVVALELIKICATNKENLPKAIFANLCTNRMGGWRLIDTLKDLDLDIPVILFSSRPSETDLLRMQREPLVKDLITKHRNTSSMMNKLAEFMHESENNPATSFLFGDSNSGATDLGR